MTDSASDACHIKDLLALYNIAIDSGDIDGFLATFAPDGIFDGVHGRFEGTSGLRKFITAYWTEPEFARLRGTQHWITNVNVAVAGDTATSYCYGTVISAGMSGNQIMGTWHYRDELVKLGGEWRFALRYVRPFTIPS
jgi:hypothetical protein